MWQLELAAEAMLMARLWEASPVGRDCFEGVLGFCLEALREILPGDC